MEAIDLKHALDNYHRLVKAIKNTEDKILVIETTQTKTGGSIIKMPENTTSDDQYKLTLIERKSRLLKDLEMYRYYLSIADDFIKALEVPYGAIVKDKYINHKRTEWIANKYGYNPRTIYKIVDRLIEMYIDMT